MSEHFEQEVEHEEKEHHIVSPFIYLTIVAILLVATGLTVWASYIDLGEWRIAPGLTLFWNPVVALAIACTKMTLVVHTTTHLILGLVVSEGPSHDSPLFEPALRQAAGQVPLDRVLADGGYDAEDNHVLAREILGIRSSVIKVNRRRTRKWPPTSPPSC